MHELFCQLPAVESAKLDIGGNCDPVSSLSEGEAAILRVLCGQHLVRMMIARIEEQVTLSDRTIRTYLKKLLEKGLIERQARRGGVALTAHGRVVARELPADAGGNLVKKPPR
jgi:predicted transcriptional regulator